MAGNSRPSFSKRQKERARQEKQAEKMRTRAEKKHSKPAEEAEPEQAPVEATSQMK